jgi:uncharacterized membrane protein YqjE
MSETLPPGGLFASLRGLLSTLIETLRVRLELVATELEEEHRRLIRLLAYGAVAFFLLAAGLIFLSIFLTMWLWEDHRLLVLGLLTLLFLGGGSIALLVAIRTGRAGSRLFSASISELVQDRDELNRDSGRS